MVEKRMEGTQTIELATIQLKHNQYNYVFISSFYHDFNIDFIPKDIIKKQLVMLY